MATSPPRPPGTPGAQAGGEPALPAPGNAHDGGGRPGRSGVASITTTHDLRADPAETLRLLALIEAHDRTLRAALAASVRPALPPRPPVRSSS